MKFYKGLGISCVVLLVISKLKRGDEIIVCTDSFLLL